MIVEHGFMESQCCSENVECILVKLTVTFFVSPPFFEHVNLFLQEMSSHYFHQNTQTSVTLYKLLEGSAAYRSSNLYEDVSFSK